MDSEKPKYTIPQIVAIQQPYFGKANDYQHIIEEYKISQEKILKLEIQLKAANDTISQQVDQLVRAKSFISNAEKLENNSRDIDILKNALQVEQRGRRAAEEKVQQLGEQLERLKTSTKVEVMDVSNYNRENVVDGFEDNSMETDVVTNDPPVVNDSSKVKDNNAEYTASLTIGGEVFQNSTCEDDEANCSTAEKYVEKNSCRTELQKIESRLLKYVNKLVAKESKPYKRQKCLNKVIRVTRKLVSSLTTIVNEEWLTYKLQSPSFSPSQSPLQMLPALYSPIQLCDETNNESTAIPTSTEPLNLPSTSTAILKNCTDKSAVHHEIDSHNNNKCTCGHESKNHEALLKHIHREVNGKPFRCDLCTNRSRDTSDLNLHYQRVHSIKTEYANGCCKCGKTFHSKVNLRKHSVLCQKSSEKVFDVSAIKIRTHF